jgi:hypothetical protein
MTSRLLLYLFIALIGNSCSSSLRNNAGNDFYDTIDNSATVQPELSAGTVPIPLTELARTAAGGFVLSPGFYETEFKTYCLQPGTPDPSKGDAYLQAPVSGYRKEIVETILLNSRKKQDIAQRNVQLLLWNVVSGSDYNKLTGAVKKDAAQLLSSKQIFELKGGVMGMTKKMLNASGIINSNNDIQRLFNIGNNAYEIFEKTAVLKEPSQLKRPDIKYDQWYQQKDQYYVRYFPLNYQKVKIQVYVPEGLLDADGKKNGAYIVYDPTGLQAVPANTNAQRLGIGGPVLDIIKVIIETNQPGSTPAKLPGKIPETKKAAL